MRKRLAAILAALLLLCACAPKPSTGTGNPPQLMLYFLSSRQSGPSILTEPYAGQEPPTPRALLDALLEGPADSTLLSPFPAGLSILSTKLEDGRLIVDFSEQYGGLTDVSLSLADYCVVLTACQFDSVDSVEITVSGRSMDYRSHQNMTRDEAILFLEDQHRR